MVSFGIPRRIFGDLPRLTEQSYRVARKGGFIRLEGDQTKNEEPRIVPLRSAIRSYAHIGLVCGIYVRDSEDDAPQPITVHLRLTASRSTFQCHSN
jgi:hypothetical protein